MKTKILHGRLLRVFRKLTQEAMRDRWEAGREKRRKNANDRYRSENGQQRT